MPLTTKFIHSIHSYVDTILLPRIQNNILQFIANQRFSVHKPCEILFIDPNEIVYEDIETGNISNIPTDECFMHNVVHLLSHELVLVNDILYQSKDKLFGLVVAIDKTCHIVYDPNINVPSIIKSFEGSQIDPDLLDEYIHITHLFSNMSFRNHSAHDVTKIPRFSLSINGVINNRPDREYYVVFGESYSIYTVQVYQLNENKKRTNMIFGFWVDSERKIIYDPYTF